MSDETTNLILGDAAAAASEDIGGRRRFFRKQKKSRREQPLTHCENCGAQLTGDYCARCGQHAIDYRRSVMRVLIDAADSIFNWDTKFLKSVGVLLVKPWKLTNDFNTGRRVRYVHPLRLYLLASIAFFLIARLINLNAPGMVHFDPQDRVEMDKALAKLAAPESNLAPEDRAKIETARAKLGQMNGTLSEQDTKQMQRALGTLIASSMKEKLKPRDHERIAHALDRMAQVAPSPSASPTTADHDADETSDNAAPSETPAAPAMPMVPGIPALPNFGVTPTISATPTTSTGIGLSDHDEKTKSDFEHWMEGRIKDKIGEDGTKSRLFLETLRSNVPTMMLCCIPLFAFVLKLLYIRQGRYYIEHLVYALHIHSFAYLATVVTVLLAMATGRWNLTAQGLTIGTLSTATVVLVFLSIRRVYKQGWFFTTFKFFLGGVVYFVILVLAVGTTAFVTLLLPA